MYTDTKLKQYNEREERFRLAVQEATDNRAASINSIATKYRVSRTTLSRRIHGFKNTRSSHEKQQKLSNGEELIIVSRLQVILRSQQEVPSKKEILGLCEELLRHKYKDTPMSPGSQAQAFRVGKNWIDRFLERHNAALMVSPEITLSEFYKNEYIQRKRVRTDRAYSDNADDTEYYEYQHQQTAQVQHQHQQHQHQQHQPQEQEQQEQQHPSLQHHHSAPVHSQSASLHLQSHQHLPPHSQSVQHAHHSLHHANPMYSVQQTSVSQVQQVPQPPQHAAPSHITAHITAQALVQAPNQPPSLPGSMSQFSFPSDEDPLDGLYTQGRFQYELARHRILKELEKDEVDRPAVVRLVNSALAQAERESQHHFQPHYMPYAGWPNF